MKSEVTGSRPRASRLPVCSMRAGVLFWNEERSNVWMKCKERDKAVLVYCGENGLAGYGWEGYVETFTDEERTLLKAGEFVKLIQE